MVSGKHKSGRFRRVSRKTPGNRVAVHFKNRKPKVPKCANCGAALKGIPRALPAKLRNMPKTKKRPERPYGGKLCSKCSRIMIKSKIK